MKGLGFGSPAANKQIIEIIYQDNKGKLSQRRIKVLSVNEESFQSLLLC